MHDWQQYVRDRLPRLKVGAERECEIVAELALQLEQAYSAALGRGATEEEAMRIAESQVRDWDRLAREIDLAEIPAAPPEERRLLSGAMADVRYALRFFRRNPAFTVLAVVTLAFGIGGNTAIFTLVDAVALRALPYRDPAGLAAIETRRAKQPEIEPWTSAPDFFDLRDHSRSFSALAGISPIWNKILTARGPAERLETLYVSAGLFPMLGAHAALGRTFTPGEDNRTKAAPVAVVSDSFWRRRLGGSADAIGATLTLDNANYTVIGVLPRDFRYAGEPLAGTSSQIDIWLPLADNPLTPQARTLRFLKVVGRLRPGVAIDRARAEVESYGAALAAQYPASNQGYMIGVQPLARQVSGRFRTAMMMLLGAVGFVLLMACANVAGLLLARASARHREISVRAALGASHYRLLRQLLTEGLVLSVLGGIVGLAVAYLGLQAMIRSGPEALVRAFPIAIDGRALLFTFGAVLLCAILAGLPPAWRILRGDFQDGLRESGRAITAGSHRLRAGLVVLQVSVAIALLVGAGLLARSFSRLLEMDPGFQPRNLLTISILSAPSIATPELRVPLWRRIHDEILSVPGVQAVAAVSRLPLGGSNLGSWIGREGHIVPGQPGTEIEYRVATPEYFGVMGIPVRAGRLFDQHDDKIAADIAVINEAAARRFWPGENPIGSRVSLGPTSSHWITIIGVVGNVRHVSMETDPQPEIYRPYAASPLFSPILVVRTSVDPNSLRSVLAAKVEGVNAGLSAYNVFPMELLVDRSTAQRRFIMLLVAGFAMMALLLAAVGIYGSVSQTVAQRTAEIGLRMALGASPSEALLMILRYGLRLMLLGIAIGAACAALLAETLRKLLFNIQPLDPAAFIAAVLALGFFALLACYIPARRAIRVDPIAALRNT